MKYDPNGCLLWARQGQSTDPRSGAHGDSVAVDDAGNSIVAGSYGGPLWFASEQPELPATLASGSFVVKYDPHGNMLHDWRIPVPLQGLASDRDGALQIVGNFAGTLTFATGAEPIVLVSDAPEGIAGGEIFVARLGADGLFRWAKQVDGSPRAFVSDVAVTTSGAAYIAGSFNGTALFGEGESAETTLVSGSGPDVFLAKYATGSLPGESLELRAEQGFTRLAVSGERTQLVVQNGQRGLRGLFIFVNGRAHSIVPMQNGGRYELELAGRLRQGLENSIWLNGFGSFGARATISIY